MEAPCHTDVWNSLKDFYGLDDIPNKIPQFPRSQLYTLSPAATTISWVAEDVAKNVMDFTFKRRLDIVRAGLSLFVLKDRPGVSCKHALIQQTIEVVHPHITKRKITVNQNDMKTLLVAGLEARKVQFSELTDNISRQLIENLDRGSMCFILNNSIHSFAIVGWKGNKDIGIVVNKKECQYLLNKL
jgi:hypothetical protein